MGNVPVRARCARAPGKRAWTCRRNSEEDQRARPGQFIDEWRREHPQVRAVGYIHFTDFVRAATPERTKRSGPDSLFLAAASRPIQLVGPGRARSPKPASSPSAPSSSTARAGLLDMQIERMSYASRSCPRPGRCWPTWIASRCWGAPPSSW
jgi:hypothetical protein